MATRDDYYEQRADTVLTMALLLARQELAGDASQLDWSLAGKHLGLIGFDPIAKAVAKRASLGFGMRVLVQSDRPADRADAVAFDAEWTSSIDHVLTVSDILSLHGSPTRRGRLINAERLNLMKGDACLLNAVDGILVDEKALVHALWFETIGGVGLSVPSGTLSRLKDFQACDNVVLLDHAEEPDQPEEEYTETLWQGAPNNVVDFSLMARLRA